MYLNKYLNDNDPNKFWRLSCGDHENLLDEAIEKIKELEEENQELKELLHYKVVYDIVSEWRKIDNCGNYANIKDELSYARSRLVEIEKLLTKPKE